MSNIGRYAPQWHVNIIHDIILRRRIKLYFCVPRTWYIYNALALGIFGMSHFRCNEEDTFAYKKRKKPASVAVQ